ncbi:nuclear pore complex protein DDB_G0274915 isoform X2 [Bradysia coprophila]|uniref:nuclear pore complex protein DDB_G0274915 isoform X2 n=1 Tax=Bradysia coprophila TaxID=38358 RepID=UPI00187D7444|nr:nuclear pore complex protein DDB_G0274915 isoform X2 [Bradysia coprophila]
MNNKKSTDSFYKPMAESNKPDDGKRNHPSAHHQNVRNNVSDTIVRQISSHSSLSSHSSPLSKRGVIDAQTYIDAQSNGLTQRIVRYEEENKKTPSVFNRAYKRAGDFPIVHLDKPKLVLTPRRNIANPPKMAKIGQPDPYSNRTNIRAEILRNGTMMPSVSLDRREDVDNVLVDPLDALKEISRKRIHCEDTMNTNQPTIEKDATDSNQSPTTNNSKRQRIAPVNSPSSIETSKRATWKCNEIFSSLSSSAHMPSNSSKRATTTSRRNSISPPQAKRLQTDKPIETPIIDTASVEVPKPVEKLVPEVAEKTYPTEPTRPKLTLFNRPSSAATVRRAIQSDECNISFVKPRPMTARYRENVDNWLKGKPDDKRRLALMLKCLSGEVDDDSDTVDSEEKVNELPKPTNPIAEDSSTKPLNQDVTEKNAVASVTSTTQADIISKSSTLLPAKPAVSFNPISTTIAPLLPPAPAVQTLATNVQPTATSVQPPATIVQPATIVPAPVTVAQAATTVEERKGGFSFPLATTGSVSMVTAVVSSTPPTIPSSSPLVLATPASTTKDPATLNPSVSFTFHPSKSNETATSTVVTAVEPTKTFTFGAATNTKNAPVFGTPAPPAETTKLTTSSTLEEPKQTPSFAAFGQATAGSINFGKNLVTSSAAPTFAFGSSSNTFNKAQPPTFGSVQTTTQQSTPSDQTTQSIKPLTFSTNGQTSSFGNTLSSTTASNAQKQTDPRISNIATTAASNQAINSASAIGSSSFVFGATTNSSATIKTTQPTLPSASSFGKPVNATPNIFGSLAPQQQSSTSIFGATATTTTSLFGQTPKVDSMKSTVPDKNVGAPNIFGSTSAAKPASTFNFSATNQPSTNNIFGSQALANTGTGNTFGFGGSNQKSDSSLTGPSSFTFSSNNTETKPVAFGATKSVAPTFGSAIDSSKSVGFPATNQTSSTNLFTNTSTNEMPKVFSFGATNNPSSTNAPASFSGTNSTFGTSTAFGAGAPAFGSTKATPSFATSATPAFGSASSTPSFGNSNAAPAFGSTNSTPSFGSANATQVFGSSNATPSFATANATPAFGSSNATPSFATANAPSAFGSSNATPSFGSAVAFGASNAKPTFGGTDFTANSGATSFGSNSNGGSSSVFGGNATPAFTTSTGSADANRTFNFTGSDPAPSPVPNLFNIGPGNSAPRGRTIRAATRRNYR